MLISLGLRNRLQPVDEYLYHLNFIFNHDPNLPTHYGNRCLQLASQPLCPPFLSLTGIPTDVASAVVKVVSAGRLVAALLETGDVVYLSSDPHLHLHYARFPKGSGRIVDIAAGACHFAACDNHGNGYTWGWDNEFGQLGQGNLWQQAYFLQNDKQKIQAVGGIDVCVDKKYLAGVAQRVDTNREHSFLKFIKNECCKNITRNSKDFDINDETPGDYHIPGNYPENCNNEESCHDNNDSLQKDEEDIIKITKPVALYCFGNNNNYCLRIAHVACGCHHTIFLADSFRSIYTCGKGFQGQLGLGKKYPVCPVPKCIPQLFGMKFAGIAAASDGNHTLAILETGKVLGWGDNKTGALGMGLDLRRGQLEGEGEGGVRRDKMHNDVWEPKGVHYCFLEGRDITDEKGEQDQDEFLAESNGSHSKRSGLKKEEHPLKSVSMKAKYDTPESYFYPRRIPYIGEALCEKEPACKVISSSGTHTCITATNGVFLTAGLSRGGVAVEDHLKQQQQQQTIEPHLVKQFDAIGFLGRDAHIGINDNVFDQVTVAIGRESRTVPHNNKQDMCENGGNYVSGSDDALFSLVGVAGSGFTIFFDGSGQSQSLRLVGTINSPEGRFIVGSGMMDQASNGSVELSLEGHCIKNVFPVMEGAIIQNQRWERYRVYFCKYKFPNYYFMGYYRERTNKHFFVSRANAFFSRLPISRIQRSLAMEQIKNGRMRPWKYTKEQILGASISLHFDYNPRPVRLIGTVMDTHALESSMKGGLKVYSRSEDANIQLWIPCANPKLRYDITGSNGTFEHYLAERDKWDEAWMTGRVRLK